PFSLEELLARINALLRRTDPTRAVGKKFTFGGLEVDVAKLTVNRDGNETNISKREAQIIQYFAANPSRVISRAELYEKVWGEPMSDLGTRTTDMHIAKLRSKIEKDTADPQIIRTVRGAGYIYQA
ncbi:MAG: response regulator transcription factor, partial [Planctomycetota bacterium]